MKIGNKMACRMVHFIIGKFPYMQKMRETFAFLADFFRIRLCNRNIFTCSIGASFLNSS